MFQLTQIREVVKLHPLGYKAVALRLHAGKSACLGKIAHYRISQRPVGNRLLNFAY